ncbi:hypothetical protein MKW94_003815 [Papaver nudicaule]|uniref:Uncharacterized protein n=1 Tax=Papaver nudicaule TaxID=74823 RepID=A0AA42AXJ7_PAPNU|nr:hypothetical protein [Papaver nudicaule]
MKKKPKNQPSPANEASPSKSTSAPSKSSKPTEKPVVGYHRRTSPRNKKSAELVATPSPPRSATLTSKRRTSPRSKNSAVPLAAHSAPESGKLPEEPPNKQASAPESGNLPKAKATPKKVVARKKKIVIEPSERTPPSKSPLTMAQTAPSKKDAENSKEGRKRSAKRKLDTSTGPCLNVQLKNPDDTLSEFASEFVEEKEDDDVDGDKVNDHDVEVDLEDELGNDSGRDDWEEEFENNKNDKGDEYVPRGPTRMAAMRLDSVVPKAEVPFNTKEQPIGNASVQLSIPLTPKDWRLVDNVSKENIWKIAMQRFIVPECFKDYYISKMGTYLKEARSRKAGAILKVLDNLQGEEREEKLEKLRPTSMTVNEWEAFVKYVNSPEFRVQRLRMQGFRKKYDTPHTISRQGYARLEAEMQEELKTAEEIERVDLWKKGHKPRKEGGPHPGVVEALKKIEKAQAEHGASSGSSVTEDVLAKALGETEKTKRLKGLGFGATHKKIVAQPHYKKIIKECQESVKAMNDRLLALEERNLKCVCTEVTTDSNNQASTSRIVFCNERASTHTPNTSPVSRTNEVQVPVKFKPCKLLSWIKEGGQVVADAEIVETDPEKEIHGYPIGLNCYSVSVYCSCGKSSCLQAD